MNYKERIDKILGSPGDDGFNFERCISASPTQGMILEFGVSLGETMKVIQDITSRPIYGFDSWEGLPEDWLGIDGDKIQNKGTYKSDPPEVASHVTLVNGLFQDSLPGFLKEHIDKIAFIHIDCDLYSSTKYVLMALKHRFIDGSVILFDEFAAYTGYEEHEYKAFIEFLEDTGYDFEFLGRRNMIAYAFRLKIGGVH
jgi:hypothetical protein